MTSLTELALQHGCDKWGSHYYTPHYERHFDRFRDLPINLLEIGVGGYDRPELGGASLRMWRDFFPRARIAALDFFDKTPHDEERIKTYAGSQADIVVLSKIVSDQPAGFDIIIDDGSHLSEHVIKSFWCLWPHVKPNGFYVIEDIQTSYFANFGGDPYEKSNTTTSMAFVKSLIDGLNWQERHMPGYAPTEFDRTIVGMSFYHNMVFMEKGDNSEGSNIVRSNVNPNVKAALDAA